MINYKTISTPLGDMLAAEHDGKLCLLEFTDDRASKPFLAPIEKYYGSDSAEQESALLSELKQQLADYFERKLKKFNIPTSLAGTEFQRSVWGRLCDIPYGQTVNYAWIASRLGNPKASRAVGRANGANPISIIIPCHRVIGKDGDLVGYGGKIWRKKWLLEHEGALPGQAI